MALAAVTACGGCREEKEPEEEEIVLHATYDLVLWNKLYNAPVANMPVELTESNSGVTFGHMTIGYDTSDANGRIKKTVRKNTIWRNGLMLNRYMHTDVWGTADTSWFFKYGVLQKFEFAWPEGNPYYIAHRNWQLRDTIFVRLSSAVFFQIDSLFGNQTVCVELQGWRECSRLVQNIAITPLFMEFYVERYTPYTFIARLMDGTRVLQTDTIRHTTGRQLSYKKFDLVNRSKTNN